MIETKVVIETDDEVSEDFFESARVAAREGSILAVNEFNKDEYEGEWL